MSLLIGILIGLVLGLTGAGGSVLAVPLLVLLQGLPFNTAAGLALGAVAASAASGAIGRARSGQVLWVPALILGAGGMVMAPVGKWLAHGIPEPVLSAGFVLLAIVIAVRMWQQAVKQPANTRVIRAGGVADTQPSAMLCPFSASGRFELKPKCIAGLGIGGLVVGVLSGMFGVGGGFLIVPLLSMLSAVPYITAVATSLVVITAVATSGFASFVLMGGVNDTGMLLQVAAGGVIGMWLGFMVGKRLAGQTLQKVFSLSVLVLSAIMLFRQTLV